MMMYQSTRGAAQVSPMQAVYEGMAPDGGLYVPAHLPQLPYGDWAQGTFVQVAQRILSAWLPGFDAAAVLQGVYDAFDTPQVVPLVQVGPAHVLELFHGPTAAFKDVALCVLPRLLKAAGQQLHPGTRLLVLIATSGDTGSAALHGFSGVEGIRALAFYPSKGISAVQRAQMVTMPGGNVAACGIQGNFDDAQSGVKRIFAAPISADVRLSSANSINIGRLVPQITYYYTAYAQLVRQGTIRAGERVDYAVPTGNFGDILAGWLAKHMGLPVGTLICATNANDALDVFLRTGVYDRRRPLARTLSPSMDILVSSNLERLLWYACDGDSAYVSDLMTQLAREGHYAVSASVRERIAQDFVSVSVSDAQGLTQIRSVYRQHGYVMDPHTAAAWAGREAAQGNRPCVVLSTASPFKFPQAMAQALGFAGIDDTVDAAERLGQALGQPVPVSLSGLGQRPVLHPDVIEAGDMDDYVRRMVDAW